MAVLARAMVTLASIKDVASTTRYYKLLSSTATAPSAPTTNPPDNTWSTTEPTYSATSTNTLYFVDLTVFSDGDFAYSEVSKSTSYEAAKSAYNVAQNAKDVADSAQESIDNLEIGGRNLGLYSKTLSASASKDNRCFGQRGGTTQIRTDGFTEQVSTQNYNGIKIYANSLGLKVSDTITFSCNVRNDSTIQNKVDFFCMSLDSFGTRDTTSKLLHIKAENVNQDGQDCIVANIEPNSEKRIWVTLTWLQLAEDFINSGGSIEFSFQSISTDWTAGSMSYYAPKIENGNVMTDWSPAPEDVETIVGGRNLYAVCNQIDGYVDGNGKIHVATYCNEKTSAYIPVSVGDKYVFQSWIPSIASDAQMWLAYQFYSDASETSKVGSRVSKTGVKGGAYLCFDDIVVPDGASYIRVSYRRYTDGYCKLERGNKATDWTPAPEDVEESVAAVSNTLTDYINSTEIIVGTQTAATGSWTGVAGFSELRDGQQIAYWLPYAGSGNASLNLTLSDGTTTGAKTVYYKGSTVATTHFSAGTVIHLTYRVNANVNGTEYTGWWADASYDSGNTYNRIRFENAVYAKSAISASRFIVGDDAGFFHLVGGSAFDITKPILWATNAIGAGKTATTNYIAINSATLRNNSTGINLTQYKTCYLVGTLSGKIFTTKLTDFFTSTIPTEDDGYYYISFGYLYSTYQVYLYPEHPIYKFVDGEFKNLNQVAYEASVLASEAKDDIENLEVGGRNLLLDSDKDTSVTTTASTNGGTVITSYFNVSDYGKNFTSSTETVFTISAWYEFTGDAIDSDTRIYVQFTDKAVASANIVGYGYRVEEIMTSTAQSGIYRRSFRLTEAQATADLKRIRMVMRGVPNGAIDTLKITKIKLELGNRATDWTQAPEDIEYAMNNVSIESSADSFINYTFNGNRSYYPTSITLTPFINGSISFSKWQYHPINTTTWVDVTSGTHGITLSANNELVIANSSDLFTDTCSAIIFKCVSDDESYYSLKTIVREDDPTRVYNTVKTRVDQTDNNLSLIASATELAEYSTSSTLNTRLSNVSLSSDEILMVVSQSVNNLTNASGIKGVYSETTAYAKNNIVILDGKFYQAKSASTGKTPPNTTYWTDVTSSYSESQIKTAFSKIVALQDSITLTVSGASGSSSTLNLGDGTMAISVTDVATILANKELNLSSPNGVINITGGSVNIGTSSSGALTINSPYYKLTDSGYLVSTRGSIGSWTITDGSFTSNIIKTDDDEVLNYDDEWRSGYHYRVGDVIHTYNFETIDGYYIYYTFVGTEYVCTQEHISSSSLSDDMSYWELNGVDELQLPFNGYVYNTTLDSANARVVLSERTSLNNDDIDIDTVTDLDETFHYVNTTTVDAKGVLVHRSTREGDVTLSYSSLDYYRHGQNDANVDIFTVSSTGKLVLSGDLGLTINGYSIGSSNIASIGNGSITGAISTLNSSKSNLLTTKFYRTNDNTISASSYKDITYNVALSGYTAIGLVGARVEGNSSVALFGFYLGTSDNTAYARVKNLTSSSQTGVKVGFTVLYVKN